MLRLASELSVWLAQVVGPCSSSCSLQLRSCWSHPFSRHAHSLGSCLRVCHTHKILRSLHTVSHFESTRTSSAQCNPSVTLAVRPHKMLHTCRCALGGPSSSSTCDLDSDTASGSRRRIVSVRLTLVCRWLLAIGPLVYAIQFYVRTKNHDGEQCETATSSRHKLPVITHTSYP
jgi:hypothetical protein